MAAPTELLASVHLFRDLDKRELRRIAGAMKPLSFPAGREIVTEGTGGVGFFVIGEGNAMVTVDGADVRMLGPGDHFGEIALLADSPRTATVKADTDVVCWGLSSWAFKPIVEQNGTIAWKLLRATARLLSER
jgi:CRP-like cAMP-binding protein